MDLYLVIEDKIDSKALYKELEHFNVNVTDIITKTFVYGDNLQPSQYSTIVAICKKYGKIDI